MIVPCEPVIALTNAFLEGAVDEAAFMGRPEVASNVGFAGVGFERVALGVETGRVVAVGSVFGGGRGGGGGFANSEGGIVRAPKRGDERVEEVGGAV